MTRFTLSWDARDQRTEVMTGYLIKWPQKMVRSHLGSGDRSAEVSRCEAARWRVTQGSAQFIRNTVIIK